MLSVLNFLWGGSSEEILWEVLRGILQGILWGIPRGIVWGILWGILRVVLQGGHLGRPWGDPPGATMFDEHQITINYIKYII
jgi:hypothetical protein